MVRHILPYTPCVMQCSQSKMRCSRRQSKIRRNLSNLAHATCFLRCSCLQDTQRPSQGRMQRSDWTSDVQLRQTSFASRLCDYVEFYMLAPLEA